MDEIEQQEQIGIKIYTTSPSKNNQPQPLIPSSSYPTTAQSGGRRRRAVVSKVAAKGVQRTLSKTSMLAHFLPTGTLLTFEMVLPSIYGVGQCTSVTTTMTVILLILCSLSCFFFHFMDSYRAPDGKVHYGFVTCNGLAVFNSGLLDVQVPKEERYNVRFSDFVHAMMSMMVFMALAFSDHRVTNCLLPGHGKEMEEAMESFPLMVGLVCLLFFLNNVLVSVVWLLSFVMHV